MSQHRFVIYVFNNLLEILLHVTVIHSVHDYQSCTTMPSKPKNVSRNVITSQNAQTKCSKW